MPGNDAVQIFLPCGGRFPTEEDFIRRDESFHFDVAKLRGLVEPGNAARSILRDLEMRSADSFDRMNELRGLVERAKAAGQAPHPRLQADLYEAQGELRRLDGLKAARQKDLQPAITVADKMLRWARDKYGWGQPVGTAQANTLSQPGAQIAPTFPRP